MYQVCPVLVPIWLVRFCPLPYSPGWITPSMVGVLNCACRGMQPAAQPNAASATRKGAERRMEITVRFPVCPNLASSRRGHIGKIEGMIAAGLLFLLANQNSLLIKQVVESGRVLEIAADASGRLSL